jgi:hypothetical protein
MKKQTVCINCKKTFWSKAIKNKVTKKIEALDNICQLCKNGIKQRQMKRGETIRVIPAEFERYIRFRELYIAEMERKKKEKEDKKT